MAQVNSILSVSSQCTPQIYILSHLFTEKQYIPLQPLIYLVGFMGCGKTTLAQHLAQHLSYRSLDTDEFVAQYTHQSITQLFAKGGEGYFRHIESACLQYIAQQYSRAIVATGGGMPCFSDNMSLINATGSSIYLKVANELLCQRLWEMPNKRPLLQGINNPSALRQYIDQSIAKRQAFYQQAHHTIAINSEADFDIPTIIAQIDCLFT